MKISLGRRSVSEGIGTAFLLIAIVGSGIMGERLAAGNMAVALLANAIATGAALIALILALGGISAHFNPIVSLMVAAQGGIHWREVPVYLVAQTVGALCGVGLANGMFGFPVLFASQKVRAGSELWIAEIIASLGLLMIIWGSSRFHTSVPFAVGCYITGAYWFVPSTSFANPAVTLARSFTDTFSGIRPIDTPGFIAAQLIGAALAIGLFRWWDQETRQ
jgi:glycerol uptake facilitator-like aquaporin